MSYMGQRFTPGGGQIFPNSQNPQFQRQYQAQVGGLMQMQYQLQQKLQNQMQNKPQGNGNARNNEFKGNNKQNSTPPNQNKPVANQPSGNLNNRPNANQRQSPAGKGADSKPGQNERNTTASATPNQNQNASPNALGKGKDVSSPKVPAKPDVKQENKDKNSSPQKDAKQTSGPVNDKGPNKPPFGNKPQGNQASPQQGSLLGRPPPPPPHILHNSQKQETKQEPDQSMNRAPQNQNFNRYNQNNDSYDQQNQGRQNQQDRGPYGRGPRGPPANNENYNRQGRNINTGGGGPPANNDFRGNPRASQPSGNYSGGAGYKGARNYYGTDKLKERVLQLFSGPLVDLPPLDTSEKKFNAYAKLFIGNIAKNTEQEELVALFEKYGEIGQVYLNKESSFAFIHFDFKANAAKAMRELDNTLFKNRYLKVRSSTINEGIRIKNISPYVSNELLEKAFSVFGMIESCRVLADERGGSKGEGIILFRDKKAAALAIKMCQEECYYLSGALRPVVVSALETSEENPDGVQESALPKNDEYQTERNITPHFADSGTFEFEFGVQWKQLYNMYDEKKGILDRDFQIEIERLEKKMVLAKVEFETEKLRKELAQREAESAHLRRHFDIGDSLGGSAGMGTPVASGSANYDSYNAQKRPMEQTPYDASLNGPYDRPQATYNDNYDRSAYPQRPAEYDRGYDQNYAAGYGREDYRRDGAGYGRDDPYDRAAQHYDRPGEMPQDRAMFDTPAADPVYPDAAVDPTRGNDPYKAPSKRPRY